MKSFENKNLIVHNHVHELVSITPLKNENSPALRKLKETSEKLILFEKPRHWYKSMGPYDSVLI